jgi:hypothetical protein
MAEYLRSWPFTDERVGSLQPIKLVERFLAQDCWSGGFFSTQFKQINAILHYFMFF